jgi:H+/gluconate symporter-like permease
MQKILKSFPTPRVYSSACLIFRYTRYNGLSPPEPPARTIAKRIEIEMNWDHMIGTIAPYAALTIAFLVGFGTFAAYFQ